MSVNRARRPRVRPQLSTGTLLGDDAATTSRHLSELADAQQNAERRTVARITATRDLVVGVNRISHGLGRRALGATVTPTVADASFAWSFSTDGDRIALITVVGVGQPGAVVEVF